MDVEWRETTINKLKMITSKLQNYSTHELFRQSQSLPYWMFTPTAVTTKPIQNKFILSEYEHYWNAKWRWNPYSYETFNIIRPILVECTTDAVACPMFLVVTPSTCLLTLDKVFRCTHVLQAALEPVYRRQDFIWHLLHRSVCLVYKPEKCT